MPPRLSFYKEESIAEAQVQYDLEQPAVPGGPAPRVRTAPRCPGCGKAACPQCLMFDELYESHVYYNYGRAMQWLERADAMVFVGTSFAVNVTASALAIAARHQAPVFNFNIVNEDCFAASGLRTGGSAGAHTLGAANVIGKCEDTLQQLLQCVQKEGAKEEGAGAGAGAGAGGVGGGIGLSAAMYPDVAHCLGFARPRPPARAIKAAAPKKPKCEHKADPPTLAQLWVACDACGKWRRLVRGTSEAALPAKWLCQMNPERAMADCSAAEATNAPGQ